MSMFEPAAFRFIKLRDFAFPGGVDVHEYRSHPCVDGTPDFLRVNVYLSKDANYVSIWSGLLDTTLAEHLLEGVRMPPDTDLTALYQQDMFRGDIELRHRDADRLRGGLDQCLFLSDGDRQRDRFAARAVRRQAVGDRDQAWPVTQGRGRLPYCLRRP